ncbi:hypothetical protein [Streptomyces sp. NPDC017868]|uniref:hypothetical protein n=1 Tax=unclassified Streptomyces TaxID=2593676 RepID=UPI00379CFA43
MEGTAEPEGAGEMAADLGGQPLQPLPVGQRGVEVGGAAREAEVFALPEEQ